MTLMLIIMATDFLFSSAYRLLRSSAVDGCRECPASPIGGGVHPALTLKSRREPPSLPDLGSRGILSL